MTSNERLQMRIFIHTSRKNSPNSEMYSQESMSRLKWPHHFINFKGPFSRHDLTQSYQHAVRPYSIRCALFVSCFPQSKPSRLLHSAVPDPLYVSQRAAFEPFTIPPRFSPSFTSHSSKIFTFSSACQFSGHPKLINSRSLHQHAYMRRRRVSKNDAEKCLNRSHQKPKRTKQKSLS